MMDSTIKFSKVVLERERVFVIPNKGPNINYRNTCNL